MAIHRVTKKLVISGNIVEYYQYEKGYLKGYENNSKGNSIDLEPLEKESNEDIRARSLQRAKKQVRRIVNSNFEQYGKQYTSKFLTLTFGANVTDVQTANYEFTKFMKRLNYKIYDTKKARIKYLVVPEFQDRGAVHYHSVFFNIPFVKQRELEKIWGHGIVDIRKVREVDNVGAYIAEYLGQEEKGQGHSRFDERLKGQKSYFCSRGIYRPIEITDKKIVESMAVDLLSSENLTYSAEFENDHTGIIHYYQYNLNKLNNQFRGG